MMRAIRDSEMAHLQAIHQDMGIPHRELVLSPQMILDTIILQMDGVLFNTIHQESKILQMELQPFNTTLSVATILHLVWMLFGRMSIEAIIQQLV